MRILDTTNELPTCYDGGRFDLEKWKAYIDAAAPGARELCLGDVREVLDAGYSWEGDCLPVLNAAFREREKRAAAVRAFHTVTDGLDARLISRFGRSVEADLVLYLGLCNGAGWVTPVNGRPTVLFGIEKIIELDWLDLRAMNGLVLHELGHVYHAQYGTLEHEPDALPDQMLWQLFTEGVAMVFEQELLGDPEDFHQYDGEWKRWCDENLDRIRRSFADDLPTMTHDNQRWFGDWVRFEGRGDVGYYLGARFVRFLLRGADFDAVVRYEIGEVREGFGRFLETRL